MPGANLSGLRAANAAKKWNRGTLITTGEWEGWIARGPYKKNWGPRSSPSTRYYYTMAKGDEKINVDSTEINIPLTAETGDSKPFLDFIR